MEAHGSLHVLVGHLELFQELLKEEDLLRYIGEHGEEAVSCGDIVNDLFIFHVFNEPKAKDLEFGELGGEHGLLDTDRR